MNDNKITAKNVVEDLTDHVIRAVDIHLATKKAIAESVVKGIFWAGFWTTISIFIWKSMI